jgi:hypothetical protein
MYCLKQAQISWWPFSPPCERRDKHQEENNKKNVKLQYGKDWMVIEIKGYAKLVKHQLKKHMQYDGTNKDDLNPNG